MKKLMPTVLIFIIILILFSSTYSTAAGVHVPDYVIYISSGQNYTMAIKANGELWGWGDNTFEQLGNGTLKNAAFPVKIMENIKFV